MRLNWGLILGILFSLGVWAAFGWLCYDTGATHQVEVCEARVSMFQADVDFLEAQVERLAPWIKECEVKFSREWVTGDSLTALITCPASTTLPIDD